VSWFVYLIRSPKGYLYTGITTDVIRRLKQHNQGIGSKWTRANRPLTLVWSKEVKNRSIASKLEHAIKNFSKNKKEKLVKGELNVF